MINPAFAQNAVQQPSLFASFIPLILIFMIFYFLVVRPSQKKEKEREKLVESIKRGDEVLTSGGILGKVVKADSVPPQKLTIEIAQNVNITVLWSAAFIREVYRKK